MRADFLSLALASLLCVASALPTPIPAPKADPEPYAIPISQLNDTEIAELNEREAALARRYPRLTTPQGLLPRITSLFTDPKPGIAYAPFKNNKAEGCKSAAEVLKDFELFKKDYSYVRLYGPACNQVKHANEAAKKTGLKLFLGIFDMNNAAGEANDIAGQLGGDWSNVDTVSMGNELVNNGRNIDEVLRRLAEARAVLRSKGYHPDKVKHAKVVTVDTWVAVNNDGINGKRLCEQSDYCAVNFHPFFDPNVAAASAGEFMSAKVGEMKAKLGNARVHICETGWPHRGSPNNKAVPSLENQRAALGSIRKHMGGKPGELILFSPFNDRWKDDNPATHNAEKWWGIENRESPTG